MAESRLTAAKARRVGTAIGLVGVAALVGLLAWTFSGRKGPDAGSTGGGSVVQTIRAGAIDIVFRSPTGTLRQGRNRFTIEFRAQDGTLVNAGAVRATATMTMPGMVMPSGMEVHPTRVQGRYDATAEFGMAGSWPMTVEWEGPGGRGSVSFEGAVQ